MRLSKPALITGLMLCLLLIIGLIFIGNYNSLVNAKANVDQSWASVETQYQRRLDLVGNLVASVKGAQGQEQIVFGKIADARTAYNNATNTNDKAAAASAVESNVALIPKLQEAYPDLKSNAQVTQLMNQLTSTEDSILSARNAYNAQATTYNISILRFPTNIFAGFFGYHTQSLFKADSTASTAPTVNFGNNK